MNENKKVFFIINKYSGAGYRFDLEGRIITACGDNNIECTIEFTQGRGHATELAQEALRQKMDAVFAVGGDGTVSEVARGLVHTNTPMGILPKGSGNGLARHLGIPMSFAKSLALISSHRTINMDTLLINDHLSVNVSGIGFDGHVAGMFGKDGKRGLFGYTRLVLKEFFAFREFETEISVDGQPFPSKSFVIALANSSQFGNNARIAPDASVCDHLVEICMIRKVPVMRMIGFAYKMFSGGLNRSAYVDIRQGKKVIIQVPAPIAYHVDGESHEPVSNFSIEVQPGSLKMLVPEVKKRI